jgi:hypothetical protein
VSFVYTRALGLLNPTVLTGDVRALIPMTNTTADTEEDTEFISGFTTLDEYDGSAYVRKALTSEAFAVDTVNNRFKFSGDALTWSTLGAGTRQGAALVIYLHVTNDADSKPLFYIDGTGFPFTGNGADITFNPHADGIMYLRNAP